MILYIVEQFFYWSLAIFIGIITWSIYYARRNYGTLEKIKGLTGVVKPYFIGGSDPLTYKKLVYEVDMENWRKYGDVFGFYEGSLAQIFISDPDIIKQVLIKDFNYFTDKRIMDFGHKYINEMLDVLPYNKWKAVRSHITPQLTTSKMRSLSILMMEGINDWSQLLEKKLEHKESYEMNVKDLYTALSTDVIARCAFGTKINAFENPNNEFVKHIKALGLEGEESTPLMSLAQIFPFLSKFAPLFSGETMDFFGNLLETILKERRAQNNTEKANDFIDVLNEMSDNLESENYKKLGITQTTVICQATILLFAGLETIAQSLSMMTCNLANHPQIQEKLRDEIDEYFRKHGQIEHESIGELVYLNACLNETLRLHTPLIRIERVCQMDWKYKDLEIKKGITVQIPTYPLHLNEKFYPDPYEFKPERFMPENKDKLVPYTFMAFGDGPHNCIGIRFARQEISMALAIVMKNYKFEPTEKSVIKMLPGRHFVNTFEPITVNFIKR